MSTNSAPKPDNSMTAVARGCPLHKPDATRRLAGALSTARHAADAGHARATIRDAWGIVSWGHEFRDGTNDHARDGLFTSPRGLANPTASAYDPRLHVPAASPSKQLCRCYLPPASTSARDGAIPSSDRGVHGPAPSPALRASCSVRVPSPCTSRYPRPTLEPPLFGGPESPCSCTASEPSPAMKVHPDGMSAYLDYGIPVTRRKQEERQSWAVDMPDNSGSCRVPEDEEASENASPPEQPMAELKELEVVMAELDGEAMKALATEIYRMLTEGQEVASGVQ